MPHYILYLFAGIILAVFSEKIDDLTGNRPFVRRLLSTLCLLLVLMAPFSEFLLEAESTMLRALRSLLPLMAG